MALTGRIEIAWLTKLSSKIWSKILEEPRKGIGVKGLISLCKLPIFRTYDRMMKLRERKRKKESNIEIIEDMHDRAVTSVRIVRWEIPEFPIGVGLQ